MTTAVEALASPGGAAGGGGAWAAGASLLSAKAKRAVAGVLLATGETVIVLTPSLSIHPY